MRPPMAAILTALILMNGACTRVGTERLPTAAPPNQPVVTPTETESTVPAFQVFGGRVWLAGEDYGLVLEVRRYDDAGVEAILEIPDLSVDAKGAGRVTLSELFLELAYGEECPGTITLTATLRDGGMRGEGRVRARDCTGTESGTISLLRRPFAADGPGLPRATR